MKEKPELLIPVGNIKSLRAAIANGADAVYLGLKIFSARSFADNFSEKNIKSVIDFCHKNKVKIYITLNTLIKNQELNNYFKQINILYKAKADAIIIQDLNLIPKIKELFPKIKIHASTQSTLTNSFIPEGIDRVILPRELTKSEIEEFSKKHETEIFIHGALCFSYSGQCLFSSIAGGRSGNRGMCAQPCRQIYNNKYSLSTKDLCQLEKLPELMKLNVKSLKIEGRMRSTLYVTTVTRIYRKYIDLFSKNEKTKVTENDLDDLKIVFNREFTNGFSYENSIVSNEKPMNRGLYIGKVQDNKLLLTKSLRIGDGISLWFRNEIKGCIVENLKVKSREVKIANKNELAELDLLNAPNNTKVYKTSSVELEEVLGEDLDLKQEETNNNIELPEIVKQKQSKETKFFVKVYSKTQMLEFRDEADILYCNINSKDIQAMKQKVSYKKFYVYTKIFLNDKELQETIEKIESLKPKGVLVSDRGLYEFLKDKNYDLHLDYSFNVFNDYDLEELNGLPIISPELSYDDLRLFKNKNFINFIHGDIILMTTKENLKVNELIDISRRNFKVISQDNLTFIYNCNKLGLFNKTRMLYEIGLRKYYLDSPDIDSNLIKTYKKLLEDYSFKDSKFKKNYTLGNFLKGVY